MTELAVGGSREVGSVGLPQVLLAEALLKLGKAICEGIMSISLLLSQN